MSLLYYSIGNGGPQGHSIASNLFMPPFWESVDLWTSLRGTADQRLCVPSIVDGSPVDASVTSFVEDIQKSSIIESDQHAFHSSMVRDVHVSSVFVSAGLSNEFLLFFLAGLNHEFFFVFFPPGLSNEFFCRFAQ